MEVSIIIIPVILILLLYYAENLNFYPPEHVIYGEYVYKTWDDQMIKHILGFFTPENMRVDVVSKSFPKSEGIFYFFVYPVVIKPHCFFPCH